MTGSALATQLGLAVAMAAAGFAGGTLYFLGLCRTVALLATGHRRLWPLAFTLARLAGAALGLFLAARCGPLALVAAFGGFLLARLVATRAAQEG